jgi:Flp pilus assembly pilin Flp
VISLEAFMSFHPSGLLSRFLHDEGGQGITEYGAILAFVAILVAVVFGITKGALTTAISSSFSAVVKQLNNLSSAAASAV